MTLGFDALGRMAVGQITTAAPLDAALAATETPDAAAFALSVTGDFMALQATETPDAAAFVVLMPVYGVLLATEPADTAAIFCDTVGIIGAALAASEAADTARIVARPYWRRVEAQDHDYGWYKGEPMPKTVEHYDNV